MDLLRKKEVSDLGQYCSQLRRCLNAFDLTLLGIGAIIGAGIFVLSGIVAATQAGPGIVYSYILAGFACAFSALSYAELAASIGGCGSAYGYAYAGLGEVVAWIVGWDLLLEYSISVSAVAAGWSGYFNDMLLSIDIHLPKKFLHSPFNGGIMDTLSILIILSLGFLHAFGIKSSARFNAIMVGIKLIVILMFIIIAAQNVHPLNWKPFLPYGWQGVVDGAALIFFAYIGFDAVSTAAEETLNPQRDLPIGIIASLFICTFLYIIVSILLTGIVPYNTLNVASPIAHALLLIGHRIAAGFISVGALAGLTTVMMVLYYGLTRVLFAMARDRLLPEWFAKVHPTTQTPIRIIIICGVIMALAAGFIPMHELAELVNVGTLFAFMMVCTGVLILRYTQPHLKRPFKTPLMPITPILGVLTCGYLLFHLPKVTLLRFVIWFLLGVGIYIFYGYRNSRKL